MGRATEAEKRAAKKFRDSLVAQGLCTHCREKSDQPGRSRCRSCTVITMAYNLERRKVREKSKTCVACGCPWVSNRRDCDACVAKRAEKWALRSVAGNCNRCGSVLDDTAHKSCSGCRELMRSVHAVYVKHKRSVGLCSQCRNTNDTVTNYCSICVLKRAATKWLGNVEQWPILEQLFFGAKQECPYTGVKLQLGVNAELDHIVARARGGTGDVANLQWVSKVVNRSKTDLSHDEFVELCHAVTLRYPR